MTLSRKKTITIVLAPANDRLLSRAAPERGVSRPEFVRQHVALVFAQYPPATQAEEWGIVGALTERGDERELFGGGGVRIRGRIDRL